MSQKRTVVCVYDRLQTFFILSNVNFSRADKPRIIYLFIYLFERFFQAFTFYNNLNNRLVTWFSQLIKWIMENVIVFYFINFKWTQLHE